jgi:hypothetical protein
LEGKVAPLQPNSSNDRWESLQENAHLPEIQEIIRREIRRGTIRVVPAQGAGIRIIPTATGSPSAEQFSGRDKNYEPV